MTCLIIGAGDGLSAALARTFSEAMPVHLAARDTLKLAALCDETGAAATQADAADEASLAALFASVEDLEVLIYNPSARVKGPITEVDPAGVRRALDVCAFGAFLAAQHAARAMLAKGRGTMLFTGASAGEKGFAQSASFAMGKFALRGLTQSLARELHPQNVHVAWINIDGAIRPAGGVPAGYPERMHAPDAMLDPAAIAQTYLAIHRQPRSAWSAEIAVRPWSEPF